MRVLAAVPADRDFNSSAFQKELVQFAGACLGLLLLLLPAWLGHLVSVLRLSCMRAGTGRAHRRYQTFLLSDSI
jgi:hypothetical protein